MDYDPVLVRLSKSPAFKRGIWFVFAGWLLSILLLALDDRPSHDFWAKVVLPMGVLLVGLKYYMGRPYTKKRGFMHWEAGVTLLAYSYAVPQRDALDVIMALVYALLSAAIVVYILYRIYKVAEKEQQSLSGKELQAHFPPDGKQSGAEVDSSLRSE